LLLLQAGGGGEGGAAAAKTRPTSSYAIFALQCLLAALAYGVVPSVLPIAVSGYADHGHVLMLATAGFMAADPIAKFSTAFFPTHRVFLTGFISFLLALIIVVTTIISPHPPFSSSPHGGILLVLANTLFSFFFSFTSTSIFFQRKKEDESGESSIDAVWWYKWTAFMIQTGAFVGTFVTLFVITYAK